MKLPAKNNADLFGILKQSAIDHVTLSGRHSRGQAGHVSVLNQTRGITIAGNVFVADTPRKRRRGLLGLPPLSPDQGVWIAPCESVHTVGMRYSIDLVYIDRKYRVVKTVEDIPPNRASFCLRARSVIEFASGTIRRSGTQVGHQLLFAASSVDSVRALSD